VSGDFESSYFEVSKEVDILSSPDQDVDALVEELKGALQKNIAPTIARCPDTEAQVLALAQDQLLSSVSILTSPGIRGGDGGRRLQETERDESEFVVRNVDMNSKRAEDRTCDTTPGEGQECIVVSTLVELFLAGPADTQVLIDRVQEAFIAGLTLENLGLNDPFQAIRLAGVSSADGSEAPSLTPSIAPSSVPSMSSAPSLTVTPAPVQPTIPGEPTPGGSTPGQPSFDGGKNVEAKRQGLVEPALATIGQLKDLNQEAVDWILNEDWWLPDAPFAASTDVWVHRYVMRVVYQETGGPNWLRKEGWLGDSSICRGWYGISCADDVSDLITGLNLDGNQLNGEIPTELGLLKPLQDLNLSTNFLNGGIPSEIGQLTSLRTLDLLNTNLQGPIPDEVAGLQAVKQVSFDAHV